MSQMNTEKSFVDLEFENVTCASIKWGIKKSKQGDM